MKIMDLKENFLHGRRAEILAWSLLVLFTFLAFLPMFRNVFVWDDLSQITENPAIRGLWPPARFVDPYELPGAGHANPIVSRPVVAMTFALDYALFKLNPFGYHLTNLILHLLCVIGVTFLTRRISRSRGAGFLAGALFALHPGHAEGVIAFLGRSHLLSTLFLLLGFWAYGRHVGARGWRKAAWYLASLLIVLVGSFSNGQVSGLVFFGLLVSYEAFVSGREAGPWWQKALRILPFLAVYRFQWIVMYHFIRVQSHPVGGYVFHFWGGDANSNFFYIFEVYARYLRLLVFPLGLSPLHQLPPPRGLWDGRVLWGMALLLGSIVATLWALRKHPWAGFLMSWFLISLIPVSNALPVPGVQILAERWLYLPSVGACALGGWGAWILYRRTRRWMRPGWALVSAIVLLLFGVRTFLWCYSWRSKESLARTMVASAPDEPLGYTNLGVALVEKGKVEEAVGEYRKAIQLKPDFFQAHYNLGNALWHQGKAEEAIAEYRRAVSLDPDFAQAYFNLGLALGERGKVEEAIVAYRRAVQLKPDYAQAHYNLGVTLGQQGKAEEAMAEYRHAIELLPDYAQALENLAAMLDVQGQRKEAKGYWERALESEKRPEWLGLIRTRLAETN